MKLEFSGQIFKNNWNLIEIRPVGAQLFHVDRRKGRRTNMTKLTVGFRRFGNGPKN